MPPSTHTPSASHSSRHLATPQTDLNNPTKSPAPAPVKTPKTPKHHIFLNKPLGTSSTVNLAHNDTAQPPLTPTGLRAQFNHLRPRHAYFNVRVQIHQISSVPLMRGEFGVRWKFKGVHTPPRTKPGLLGIVRSRSRARLRCDSSTTNKGKAKEEDDVESLESAESRNGHQEPSVTEFGCTPQTLSVTTHRSASGTSTQTTSSQASSSYTHASLFTEQHLTADWSATSSTLFSSTNASRVTISQGATSSGSTFPFPTPSCQTPAFPPCPARGMTPFLKLKDHAVSWQHTLSTALKFDVERDTLGLLPNPLKLIVMQRVIPDDPDGNPSNPRLGAVYLNLAEYVGQGSVERRYLLRESKTNATLKLTIELEHIGGETQYIPPPLPKGEILTGIAGFLENDVYRKRPRELDLYGPYQDQQELEFDLLGGPLKSVKTAKPRSRRPSNVERNQDVPRLDSTQLDDGERNQNVDNAQDRDDEDEDEQEEAFDVHRLHVAYGPKTTEALIEALFNPVKTTEKRRESPFTYYEPKTKKPARGVGLGLTMTDGEVGEKDATPGKRPNLGQLGHITYQPNPTGLKKAGSVCSTTSTSSSSASVRTTSSSSKRSSPSLRSSVNHAAPEGRVVVDKGGGMGLDGGLEHAGGVRGWWRKVASRPGTPTLR